MPDKCPFAVAHRHDTGHVAANQKRAGDQDWHVHHHSEAAQVNDVRNGGDGRSTFRGTGRQFAVKICRSNARTNNFLGHFSGVHEVAGVKKDESDGPCSLILEGVCVDAGLFSSAFCRFFECTVPCWTMVLRMMMFYFSDRIFRRLLKLGCQPENREKVPMKYIENLFGGLQRKKDPSCILMWNSEISDFDKSSF